MAESTPAGSRKRIVILGGGFGGAYAAQELSRHFRQDEVEVTVVDRNNYLLFYPLLVEAGVGTLEPRHVVVPTRKFMSKGDFRMAEVIGIDTASQQVQIQVVGSDSFSSLHYDHLVFGLGSVTKIPSNIAGLKKFGFELKSLSDAIELRDRGIRLLELANTISDLAERRSLLSIIVIGANFTGVELAGEYQAFLTEAAKDYKNIGKSDIKVMILEYADRILPAVGKDLADWCHKTLVDRGLDIRTKTSVTEVGKDYAILTTGERVATHTIVWAAGIAPSPLVKQSGLPTNDRGYIECERDLRVKGFDNVWAIGDSAAVRNKDGKPYAATAQNASRQGPTVAKNIERVIRGEETRPFDFNVLGSFAAIGHRSAAAEVMGRNITGFAGWFLYRSAYLFKMPSLAMKVRLMIDWTLELIFRTAPVQLGVHRPESQTLGELPKPRQEIGSGAAR